MEGSFLSDRTFGVVDYVPVPFTHINVFVNLPKIIGEDLMELGILKVFILARADHDFGGSLVRFASAKGFQDRVVGINYEPRELVGVLGTSWDEVVWESLKAITSLGFIILILEAEVTSIG